MLRARLLGVGLLSMGLMSTAHAAPCAGFTDVDTSSPFCVNVAWMKNRGITLGLTPTLYDPNSAVTRLQMAVFMYRLGYQNAFLDGGNAFATPPLTTPAVIGTSDYRVLDVHVGSARAMRFQPDAISPNVIGGHSANFAKSGVRGATIAGGGVPTGPSDPDFAGEAPNVVNDSYGTVGGGLGNRAGGGAEGPIDRPFATVSGGFNNHAEGAYSVVAGGSFSSATGAGSTSAGGIFNDASGDNSFAAGRGAQADQNGCFAFVNWSGGGSGSCLGKPRVARFLLDHGLSVDYHSRRQDGGGNRWVYIGDHFAGLTIATWKGANLDDNGMWNSVSDAEAKEAYQDIDSRSILERVAALPIRSWRYKGDASEARHIGPTAQDFGAAFGRGADAKTIGMIDADGVALAAIQGLNAKLEATVSAQAAENARLRDELSRLGVVVEKMAALREPAKAPLAEASP